jgi:hypothetical protein
MKRMSLITAAVAAAGVIAPGLSAVAQTTAQTQKQAQAQAQTQAQTQERIYGSQLMTPQERNEYQQKMGTLKTQQERDQLRSEHHAKMQDRARERGVTLPDAPPAQGKGAGPRAGNAPGMGAGPGPGAGGSGGSGGSSGGGGKGR